MTQQNDIKSSLQEVRHRIIEAYKRTPQGHKEPRLVAVSKMQHKHSIIEAYHCGQRHFGENYIQELFDKSTDHQIIENCPEIKWHMIGHIQSNKVHKLLSVKNLYMVETIDSEKLAESLNKNTSSQLKVMVQINTSGEENKSGVEPSNAETLISFIKTRCPKLEFVGLMTIGAFDFDTSKGPNPDFQTLIQCREKICKALQMNPTEVELSMGMTADYEHAVEVGSTNVRVGSAIFGARNT